MNKGTFYVGLNGICACMEQIFFDYLNDVSPAVSSRKCVRRFGSDTYSLALKFWETSLRLLIFGGC